jgi:GTP cyclohydrolase II
MNKQNIKFIEKVFFPTKWGEFDLYTFEDNQKKIHFALVRGNVENKENVVCRIHSKCITGDALGSLRCDCRRQYEKSMEYIAKKNLGVLIYLDQEGRGIGLKNKIKAYALQDQGYDTVEANLKLGFNADERDFSLAAKILKLLKIKSIFLITNNPKKIEELKKNKINIIKRIALKINGTKYSKKYLQTKKIKLGHFINEQDDG